MLRLYVVIHLPKADTLLSERCGLLGTCGSSPYAIANEFILVVKVYADEGIVCDIRYFL